jgi:hypothetical protein
MKAAFGIFLIYLALSGFGTWFCRELDPDDGWKRAAQRGFGATFALAMTAALVIIGVQLIYVYLQ